MPLQDSKLLALGSQKFARILEEITSFSEMGILLLSLRKMFQRVVQNLKRGWDLTRDIRHATLGYMEILTLLLK